MRLRYYAAFLTQVVVEGVSAVILWEQSFMEIGGAVLFMSLAGIAGFLIVMIATEPGEYQDRHEDGMDPEAGRRPGYRQGCRRSPEIPLNRRNRRR